MSTISQPLAKLEPAARAGSASLVNGNGDAIYGRAFWLAYLANSFLMVAITLVYRYADLVTFLGGDELDLGRIVGVGMVGSLAMRFAQGAGIDHYGPRKIWLWSLVLFVISVTGHVYVSTLDTPTIYLLRIAYSTSLAGAFGASITCVSRSMPAARMAEVIGALGTSGFLAMALGPLLGDLLRGNGPLQAGELHLLFMIAGGLGILSLICAAWSTHGETVRASRRRPPLLWLLRRYHPGSILLMSIGMGVGLSLPATFLPTFAADLKITHVGGYWTVYALTAFITRIATRRFPSRFGMQPMIYLGLSALILSLLCFLPVKTSAHLIVPGFFGGIAHALLFPAVIASGSAAFPHRYRGLGTTLMLAMVDLGTLIGAPLAGGIVDYGKHHGLPAYPMTFIAVAVSLAMIGAVYMPSPLRSKISPRPPVSKSP